jgi:hypothetical protein
MYGGYARRMAIDSSGTWWIGTETADLDVYLRDFTAASYPADRFVHARCACGSDRFALAAGEDCAQRTCVACRAAHLMLDSAEYWDDAEDEPDEAACPCGAEVFELAVGFSHRDDGSLKWVSIGCRCVACGILGVYVDWKIDYGPADHLYAAV